MVSTQKDDVCTFIDSLVSYHSYHMHHIYPHEKQQSHTKQYWCPCNENIEKIG